MADKPQPVNQQTRPATIPPPPKGWGDEVLSQHLSMAVENQFATFVGKPKAMHKIMGTDACFYRIATHLNETKDFLPALFLLRCHSAWRAAVGLAMATQVPETFPVLRSCLEYAGYALLIARTPGLAKVWIRRHDGDKEMAAMKKAFVQAKVCAAIAKHDKKLEQIFREQFERCIDWGAHPNLRALASALTITENENRKVFNQAYFAGNGIPLDHAMRTAAQSGVCCLHIFYWIFQARFDLLSISERLKGLRKDL